jgi:transcriptional regulator of arginine metabolism
MEKIIKSQERQNIIKKIIEKHAVKNQDHLIELLNTLYGIEISQAMISRDLQALGIAKMKHKGQLIYEQPRDVRREILRLGALSVEYNESMIVVNTLGGMAPFIGDCLDMHKSLGILGTLAGENVVFVIPHSIKNIEKITKKIKELLKQ